MKRILFMLFVLSIPILIMTGVNGMGAAPVSQYDKSKCTRYCHNSGCLHNTWLQEDNAFHRKIFDLYVANIQWLKRKPLGLDYKGANLFVYVVVLPVALVLLLWGILRK